MSYKQFTISPIGRYTFASKNPKKGDGIKAAVMNYLSKWPTATPEQIGNQLGIQPELVERIIEADKKRKIEGY